MSNTQMQTNSLGLARPRGQREKCLCLHLLCHLSDEMLAEGLVGERTIPELTRRYQMVLNDLKTCPLSATCNRYNKGKSSRFQPAFAFVSEG